MNVNCKAHQQRTSIASNITRLGKHWDASGSTTYGAKCERCNMWPTDAWNLFKVSSHYLETYFPLTLNSTVQKERP